ncbi:hypothetical protein HPB49_004842 [Dermacentor silvarum]|uniref:Uncharacterized protein n=1 Tax=Dermacentor silvarum TaxID=543639 RepID=A0ACB8DI11_DERSI|nr:hypothetical protein HPB49_004842 [Dermacentor silvarum]
MLYSSSRSHTPSSDSTNRSSETAYFLRLRPPSRVYPVSMTSCVLPVSPRRASSSTARYLHASHLDAYLTPYRVSSTLSSAVILLNVALRARMIAARHNPRIAPSGTEHWPALGNGGVETGDRARIVLQRVVFGVNRFYRAISRPAAAAGHDVLERMSH